VTTRGRGRGHDYGRSAPHRADPRGRRCRHQDRDAVGHGDQYLAQLRPLVTDEVAQGLRDKVVIPVPTVPFRQKGVVRSIGVEAVNDGAATAIAVVHPARAAPPRSVDQEPSDIILWLLLARFEDRWVLANRAPLGVRRGYPG
jgi:hypothetical protein